MAAACAAIACALAAGPVFAAASDHLDHQHRLVRIGAGSLHPQVLEIDAGDAFGWLNYGDAIAVVSFDAAVAERMLCKQRSSFRLTGDRIESGEVQALQFVSLCSLAPGEYTYRVDMRTGIGSGAGIRGRSLEGRIRVR